MDKKINSNCAWSTKFIIGQLRPAEERTGYRIFRTIRCIQDSKWDGFQSTVLNEVAKIIPETLPINYLREFEGRETGDSEHWKTRTVNTIFFLQNEEKVELYIINPETYC